MNRHKKINKSAREIVIYLRKEKLLLETQSIDELLDKFGHTERRKAIKRQIIYIWGART
ncbi:MAG: hypothetical protein M0R47_15985 [Methylobacter sp.]|uniref:hypothetical protein n=1 Tax=Methylobacter sp. TaxID=2051955 RepID=UPI0025FCE1E4|nr:hypothetical protein [Methylobacter sp.]MCK9622021.1 hypothetical protein [Methylobacter sp.]